MATQNCLNNKSTGFTVENGNLTIPATIAGGNVGYIKQGVNTLVSTLGVNLFVGTNAGNVTTTGTLNCGIGDYALNFLTTGRYNSALGSGAGTAISTGEHNAAIGNATLSTLSTGTANTGLGNVVLQSLDTGDYNIAVGYNSGSQYTGAESNNILIGNIGVLGESNIIRIGSSQSNCYLAGSLMLSDAISVDSSYGNVGDVLTSAGAGSPAVWAPAAGGGMTWVDSPANNTTLAPNTGYFAIKQGVNPTNFYLPANPTLGDTYTLCSTDGQAWTITLQLDQQVFFNGTGYLSTLTCSTTGASAQLVYWGNYNTAYNWFVVFSSGTVSGT